MTRSVRPTTEAEDEAGGELVAWLEKHRRRESPGMLAGMLLSAAAELLVREPFMERGVFIEIAGNAWDRWQLVVEWRRRRGVES